jgi:hypothetical protein
MQTQQFSRHLYKDASCLEFRDFSCLVKNYRVFHHVSSLRGNNAAVLSSKIAAKVLASLRIIELWFEAW